MSQRIVTPPPRVISQPPRHRPGKWGTLVAVAAAVVIVAMLAWVFQSMTHSRLAGQSTTPVPTSVPHITHPRGHWADAAQYTLSSGGILYVAPTDPRVAFRAVPSPADPTVTALSRTTDGGATWANIALPTDDGGWFGGLAISPLDQQTVFLTLGGDQNNPHCPAYALGPGTDIGPAALKTTANLHASVRLGPLHPTSGGYMCSFQYVSRDGGAHWSHPTFPWPAQHFAGPGSASTSAVEAQGSALFAAVIGNLNGQAFDGVRLAASTDGGTTWTAADAAIYATGQIVTDYTAIPGTTTLYALSVPQQTAAGQESSAEMWSSQDAGAHWSRLGTAPLVQATLIGATVPGFGPILYAAGIKSGAYGASLLVYASRDGGHTWSQAPSAGPPGTGASAPPEQPMTAPSALGILDDGSLLEFFHQPAPNATGNIWMNADVSFYAWRPGDSAWFQAAPGLASGLVIGSWLTTPANGGPQTVWIVVQSQQGTTFTVRKCVLQ